MRFDGRLDEPQNTRKGVEIDTLKFADYANKCRFKPLEFDRYKIRGMNDGKK